MTFKEFLSKRDLDYDAKSYFARLASADPHFPDPEYLWEVEAYVLVQHCNDAILRGAIEVWNDYLVDARRSVH